MTVDDFLREIQAGPPCSGDHVIQHLNPHCPGPKLVAKLEAAEKMAKAFREYAAWMGPACLRTCPGDDTCSCEGKAINDSVGAAMRAWDAAAESGEATR